MKGLVLAIEIEAVNRRIFEEPCGDRSARNTGHLEVHGHSGPVAYPCPVEHLFTRVLVYRWVNAR